jgi:hypothetical protein
MTVTVERSSLTQSVLEIQELADYIVPFALRIACELGVADELRNGPRPGTDIAAAVGADADTLHRVMRALAGKGVFAETEPGCWGLTPSAMPLTSDHERSLAGALPLLPPAVRAWGRFDYTLRTARPAFDLANGMSFSQYLAEDPGAGRRLEASLATLSPPAGSGPASVLDWPACGTIVDTPAVPLAPAAATGPVGRLLELGDLVVPFAVRATCDLGIADQVCDGPVDVDELARRVGVSSYVLQRTLRALALKGVFAESREGTFELSPLAALMLSDHPVSLRGAYPLLAANFDAWAHFGHTVRTGQPAFELVHGKPYYDYLAQAPHDSERFNAIQRAGNRLEVRSLVRAWDWRNVDAVVDVGGGDGAFLAVLLARNRDLHGILLDLPHAVRGAAERFARAGVADRAEVVAGSFHEAIPYGSDTYVLKRVLYDWADVPARRLLERIRRAMRPDSRLLVIDPVIVPGNGFDPAKVYDLLSLTMLGGRARSKEELRALLASAGFRVTAVIETTMLPVLESRPA